MPTQKIENGPRTQIGEKIKIKRVSKGLSQENLARLLKVSWATVCRWEQGQRMPTPGNLERLEATLGPILDPEDRAVLLRSRKSSSEEE